MDTAVEEESLDTVIITNHAPVVLQCGRVDDRNNQEHGSFVWRSLVVGVQQSLKLSQVY